jgi:hypothetical protein
MTRPKVLKDIRVREVSAVTAGAGHGVRILLRKRADGTEERLIERPFPGGGTEIVKAPNMSATEIEKTATGLWESCVTMIAKREGCTRTEAYTRALRDPVAREAFDLARDVYMAKAHHGVSPPADPFDTTAHNVTTNDPAWRRYQDSIRKHVASGMSMSKAQDMARREMSEEDWASVKSMSATQAMKASPSESPTARHGTESSMNNPSPLFDSPGRSPLMLPRSADGNAPVARGSYSSPYGGGRPYR